MSVFSIAILITLVLRPPRLPPLQSLPPSLPLPSLPLPTSPPAAEPAAAEPD